MKFLGIGSDQMRSIEKQVVKDGLVSTDHGLGLRQGNANVSDEVKSSLRELLSVLPKRLNHMHLKLCG